MFFFLLFTVAVCLPRPTEEVSLRMNKDARGKTDRPVGHVWASRAHHRDPAEGAGSAANPPMLSQHSVIQCYNPCCWFRTRIRTINITDNMLFRVVWSMLNSVVESFVVGLWQYSVGKQYYSSMNPKVLFHNDFSSSGEQTERRILAHDL